MLYTTQQIAQMYSGKDGNVTPSLITQRWNHEGLKHIKGRRNGFLYKKEWVDEFIENKATIQAMEKIDTSKMVYYKNGKLDKELIEHLKYARMHNRVI